MKKNLFFCSLFSISFLLTNAQVSEKTYAKFDFIPGEQVLFEDNFLGESADEIPSHWVLAKGKVETVKINGEMVMGMLDASPAAYPRLSGKKTFSNRFTLEFDYLLKNNSKKWITAVDEGNIGTDKIQIQFANDAEMDKVKEQLGDFESNIEITSFGEVSFKTFRSQYRGGKPVPDHDNLYEDLCDKWVHVSVAVTEKSLKVYLNSERVLNAPIQSGVVSSFQLLSDGTTYEYGTQVFIKNVRVAAGGADPYKTLTTDGKIIARGINFDVAKATLKPESLGAINSILSILKEHPELKFEIGGHTDSDGDDASNLKLSQERADAVKAKLVELGVAPDRLSTKGYGETKPMDDNKTFEGKANNRRVEFVKI